MDDTELLNEWQQIQSFPSPPTAQSNDQRNIPVIPHQQPNSPSYSSSPSSHSLSSPPPPDDFRSDDISLRESLRRAANDFGRHLKLPFRVLRFRILQIAKTLRCYVVFRRGFWSFACVAGVLTALLLSLLYLRVQRWRTRIHQDNSNRFAFVIKQKDEVHNFTPTIYIYIYTLIRVCV